MILNWRCFWSMPRKNARIMRDQQKGHLLALLQLAQEGQNLARHRGIPFSASRRDI